MEVKCLRWIRGREWAADEDSLMSMVVHLTVTS